MPVTVYFLETPTETYQLVRIESREDVALEVLAALLNDQEPWCRLWIQGNRHWVNRYTVMERDAELVPTQILSEQFDGTTGMIRNIHEEE